ncbi:hypothetical protein DIURU_004296 [Diutina rugosa]|uniref:Uncharacterized protein n=1 Tax=Diutina rugosa TaxID=5481 RepID=A0A642UI29_DIURU|nr:uncharacterized protein DIURU_004296 [Diutina rugosa]KAA8899454.1 hypothetical protein DIURU_004296 [Diutina rugosa]
MSYMIVPSVSYQTKQKLKEGETKRQGKKRHQRSSRESDIESQLSEQQSVLSGTSNRSAHSGRSTRSNSGGYAPRHRADSVVSMAESNPRSVTTVEEESDDAKSVSSKRSVSKFKRMFSRKSDDANMTPNQPNTAATAPQIAFQGINTSASPPSTPKIVHPPSISPLSSSARVPQTPATTPSTTTPRRPAQLNLDTPTTESALSAARQNSAVSPHSTDKFTIARRPGLSPRNSAKSDPGTQLKQQQPQQQQQPQGKSTPVKESAVEPSPLSSHEHYYTARQPFSARPEVLDPTEADSIGFRFSKGQIAHNPDFLPIVDPCALNDPRVFAKHMITPTYQYLRYATFLDIMSDHHRSDPITFASVRLHSIYKFCARHQHFVRSTAMTPDHPDIRYYEGALASELLKIREAIRQDIDRGCKSGECTGKYWSVGYPPSAPSGIVTPKKVRMEELVQTNVINHVRYTINLPEDAAAPLPHKQFKKCFVEISEQLYSLKRDELGGEVSREFLMVSTIAKVSYDFILLEKYHLQILTKFLHNSLTAEPVLRRLWDKSVSGHTPQILLLNSIYSVQFGWYFSNMVPFCRVFESSIFNEARPHAVESSFWEPDAMERDYFGRLDFGRYSRFREMSVKSILETIKNHSAPKMHRPFNFKFYPGTLGSIPSASVDLVQCRDPYLQFTEASYRQILDEFHRILTTDGVLELPFILFHENRVLDLDLTKEFEMMPDFFAKVMAHLKKIFNVVKYSVMVLDPTSEVCSFVIHHTGLQLYDRAGKLDDYCDRFAGGVDEIHPDLRMGTTVHHYVHIRAEK